MFYAVPNRSFFLVENIKYFNTHIGREREGLKETDSCVYLK